MAARKQPPPPEPPKPEPPAEKILPGAPPGEVPARCIVGSQDLKWFYLLTTPQDTLVYTDDLSEAWEFTNTAEALAMAKECSEAEDRVSGRRRLPDNEDITMMKSPSMMAYLLGARGRLIPLKG